MHPERRGLVAFLGRNDVLGAAFVIAAALGLFWPALIHGPALGPFGLARSVNIRLASTKVFVHNPVDSDWIFESEPWELLNRAALAHLQLPLWNRFSGLGMPEMANMQSSVFGLPDLIGYLVPKAWEFLVTVAARVVIAGTGGYVLARVLGVSPLGSALSGVSFELSGSMAAWSGWPFADVFCWLGWALAFGYLIYCGRARSLSTVGLALCVAFAVYGGQPEALAISGIISALFFAALVACDAASKRAVPFRRLARLTLSGAAGLALGAPLILPGAQLASGSVRAQLSGTHGLALKYLLGTISGGWCGSPLSEQRYFCSANYYEAVSYIGVIVLGLALAGLAFNPRRSSAIALSITAVVIVVIAYRVIPGFWDAFSRMGLESVEPLRARLVLGLFLGVLAGYGLDGIAGKLKSRHGTSASAQRSALAGSLVAMGAVGAVGLVAWLFAPQLVSGAYRSAANVAVRRASLEIPLITCAVTVVLLAGLLAAIVIKKRSTVHAGGRYLGVLLVVLQALSAIYTTEPLLSFSHQPFPQEAALVDLKKLVGTSLLAVSHPGSQTAPSTTIGLWVIPEENIAYGLKELGIYDTMAQAGLFMRLSRSKSFQPSFAYGWLVPSIDSAAEARRFGVGYIAARSGSDRPAGTVLAGRVGKVSIWRVPDASMVSFDPSGSGERAGHPRWISNNEVDFTVATPRRARLLVDITDVPGWHATLSGRPTPLLRLNATTVGVELPPGKSTVKLVYWPRLLTLGAWIAFFGLLGLGIDLVWYAKGSRGSLCAAAWHSRPAVLAAQNDQLPEEDAELGDGGEVRTTARERRKKFSTSL